MKKTILTLFTLGFLAASSTYAQVGIGTQTPDASAILELESTEKGLLPPRMTSLERDAIVNPKEGLIIYNTNANCVEIFIMAKWFNVCLGGESNISSTDILNPHTGKVWMDRNLGASQVATSSTDEDAYGDLYQWGRSADGHQIRTSGTTTTLSSTTSPGHGDFITQNSSPSDWLSPQNNNLWQGVNGVNNPCPNGYRLPTQAEWSVVSGGDGASTIGWSNASDAFNSPLKLPMAGRRLVTDGLLLSVGSRGDYWSSTVSSVNASILSVSSNNANMSSNSRGTGLSVRCIKD